MTARVIVPIAPAVREWIAAVGGGSASRIERPSNPVPSTNQASATEGAKI
jgi:hypothetical protein